MKKAFVIFLAGIALIALVVGYRSATNTRSYLEYYEALELPDSKAIHGQIFEKATNGAWVIYRDNGIFTLQPSEYRVTAPGILTFEEEGFLVIRHGYKAHFYGEDWVVGSVMYIPEGKTNYLNIGKVGNSPITVEEARESVLYLTVSEIEACLNSDISISDKRFLIDVLSYKP